MIFRYSTERELLMSKDYLRRNTFVADGAIAGSCWGIVSKHKYGYKDKRHDYGY